MTYLTIIAVTAIVVLTLMVRRVNPRVPDEGDGGVVGLVGTAEETFTTAGTVLVRGELWKATARKGIIERGQRVRVVRLREGLTVEVEKVE